MGLFTLLRRPRNAGFVPADIPQSEADALIALYNATDGANWTTNTNWLTDPTVNNWHGITVSGGKVNTIDLDSNNLNGSVADFEIDAFTALEYLYLHTNSISGDISGWTLPSTLLYLFIYTTSVSGDVANWTIPSTLLLLRIYSTSLSGSLDMSTATAIDGVLFYSCSLSQAAVDGTLQSIYTNRASFTHPDPVMHLGGSNTAPSGTYQDGDPPTTGLEYAYEVCEDPETEGFNTWAVVWNGGSGPAA